MRILFLSQLVPYPVDAGPKVRSYHVLQYLATAGHEVSLLTFCRASDQPEAINHLRGLCETVHVVPMHRSRVRDAWHLVAGVFHAEPFLIRRDGVAAMYQAVRERLTEQHFDAVHADQLWMAQYALAAQAQLGEGKGTRFVLDQHNAMYLIPHRLAPSASNKAKRLLLQRESRQMARYEVQACAQFDHVIWVTEEDRVAVELVGQSESLPSQTCHPTHSVIPICVDPAVKTPVSSHSGRRRVTFLGGLHWPPNAEGVMWFARAVWPLVASQIPDATLTVIGKNPPPALLDETAVHGRLEVTGYVEDPRPYLAETAAFIVPLQAGGGMRVKIVDAWSWGLPVVSTSIGAEGICYQDGENLLIANEPGSFAAAVVDLLRRPTRGAQIGALGRRTVEEYYDWHQTYQQWDHIYPKPS